MEILASTQYISEVYIYLKHILSLSLSLTLLSLSLWHCEKTLNFSFRKGGAESLKCSLYHSIPLFVIFMAVP